jgi:hypothetical protein
MTTDTEETVKRDKFAKDAASDKDSGCEATTKLARSAFVAEVPVTLRACLEIIGFSKGREVVELGQGEAVIGRMPGCTIRLSSTNVSRRHARVIFRNEEYHIEDLGSTNGTYVNGIRVAKCALRSNDQIDIGGVKILFTEERILEKI